MKASNIIPEDLFKDGFKDHETAFDPSAWEHMKSLLDEDDQLKPIPFVPEQKTKNSKRFLILILSIMSTLTLITATWLAFNSFTASNESMKNTNIATKSENSSTIAPSNDKGTAFKPEESYTSIDETSSKPNEIAAEKPMNSITPTGNSGHSGKTSTKSSSENSQKPAIDDKSVASNSEMGEMDVIDSSLISNGNPIDSMRIASNNGKTYQIFIRRTWVPEEYEWIEDKNYKAIHDGFFGIHFTAQKNKSQDSMGSAGLNVQFMSGNRLHSNNWGVYGGFDWGMQFYGKGNKSNVALNNTAQDSGFTRLRSHSMDFLGRGHFEYAKFPLIPYFNIMAGPRIYATNQQTASYVQLKETESSTSNNAHTSVSMLYGFGAGLRLKLSQVISLDFRYEWINGTKVKQVDLKNSTFNGLNYDLKYNSFNPRQEQFKFGVLFNISERQYEKKLIKEGYYKETLIDSLLIDPKDSNRVYLPCNCSPCDDTKNKETYTKETHMEPTEENIENEADIDRTTRSRTNGSSGSGSGKSKGSFPGIKPPTTRPSEKR